MISRERRGLGLMLTASALAVGGVVVMAWKEGVSAPEKTLRQHRVHQCHGHHEGHDHQPERDGLQRDHARTLRAPGGPRRRVTEDQPAVAARTQDEERVT